MSHGISHVYLIMSTFAHGNCFEQKYCWLIGIYNVMNFNPAEGGGGPCCQGGIVWNSHKVPRWSQAEFMFSDFLFLVLMVLSWAVTLGKCTSSAKALNFQNLCILLWSAISPRVGLLIDKCVMTELRTASSRLGGRVFSGYYDRGLGRYPTGTSRTLKISPCCCGCWTTSLSR